MSSSSEFGDFDFDFTEAELDSIPNLSTQATSDSVPTPAGIPAPATRSSASFATVSSPFDMISDADLENPSFLAELEVSLTQFERSHVHAASEGSADLMAQPLLVSAPSASMHSRSNASPMLSSVNHNTHREISNAPVFRSSVSSTGMSLSHGRREIGPPVASTSSTASLRHLVLQRHRPSRSPSSDTRDVHDDTTLARRRTKTKTHRPPSTSNSLMISDEKIRMVLAGFEDSLSCTICSDYFVCPNVAIPCGHSFCGQCIVSWIGTVSQKRKPTCPTCRTALILSTPMAPNYALESLVDAHIEALGVHNVQGWSLTSVKIETTARGGTSNGSELREAWEKRKQEWKAFLLREAAKAAMPAAAKAKGIADVVFLQHEILDVSEYDSWDGEDEEGDDEEEE